MGPWKKKKRKKKKSFSDRYVSKIVRTPCQQPHSKKKKSTDKFRRGGGKDKQRVKGNPDKV